MLEGNKMTNILIKSVYQYRVTILKAEKTSKCLNKNVDIFGSEVSCRYPGHVLSRITSVNKMMEKKQGLNS